MLGWTIGFSLISSPEKNKKRQQPISDLVHFLSNDHLCCLKKIQRRNKKRLGENWNFNKFKHKHLKFAWLAASLSFFLNKSLINQSCELSWRSLEKSQFLCRTIHLQMVACSSQLWIRKYRREIIPIASMYGIFTYIYHRNPTIHGSVNIRTIVPWSMRQFSGMFFFFFSVRKLRSLDVGRACDGRAASESLELGILTPMLII